jgi:hypothetical protein
MEDLIDNALKFHGTSNNLKVLDIGANDGTLLGLVKKKINAETIGVDPTHAVLDTAERIDHPYCEFFTKETSSKILSTHGFPDIITFTNVFAHIENLPALIEAVSMLLNDDNLLVIENHYLGSVLEKNQFDTFYAEHIRTYSAKSFTYIAKQLNLDIKSVQFPKRYGGNIRVYLSRNPKYTNDTSVTNENHFVEKFEEVQKTYDLWLKDSSDKLEIILKDGLLIGKSCPARSVMLYSSLKMNVDKMSLVYEHPNSPKIGFTVPGTEIPIVSDVQLSSDKNENMILWSWHIAYELIPYLKEIGYRGNVWSPLPQFKLIASL